MSALHMDSFHKMAVGRAMVRRQQQIAKGYDQAHDDSHFRGELALSAATILLAGHAQHIVDEDGTAITTDHCGILDRPRSRIEQLEIAVALALAELERVLRDNALTLLREKIAADSTRPATAIGDDNEE